MLAEQETRTILRLDDWDLSEKNGTFYADRKRSLTDDEISHGLSRQVFAYSDEMRVALIRRQQQREDNYNRQLAERMNRTLLNA